MIVFLILFILALYFYFQDSKGEVLFCLMALGSSCFNFVDASESPIKNMDFILVFTLLTCIDGYLNNNRYFSLSKRTIEASIFGKFSIKILRYNDMIGAVIIAIVGYVLLNFLGTVLFHIDSFSNALKVARPFFAFLIYFYFRSFKLRDFSRFLYLILIASLIQGFFYYLQLFGINVLVGRVDEAKRVGEITRYANYPSMASFFVYYFVLKAHVTIFKRIFFVLFFGSMLILGQMRGAIISMGFVFALFFLLKRKMKYVGYILVGVIVYQFAIAPMFEYRTRNSSSSTIADIVSVVKNPMSVYKNYMLQKQEGSFSFRIAMLSERVAYLFDNPQYLPFGVGCIHEESPANTFHFYLGTHDEMYKYGYVMLSSADIAWLGILMRFGLIGILLFIFLFYFWIRAGIPLVINSNNKLFIISSILVVSYILSSFNSDNMGRVSSILSLSFYLSVIYSYKRKKYSILNKS